MAQSHTSAPEPPPAWRIGRHWCSERSRTPTPPATIACGLLSPPRRCRLMPSSTPARHSRAEPGQIVGEQITAPFFPPSFGPGSEWGRTRASAALRGRLQGGGERRGAPSAACHPFFFHAQTTLAHVDARAHGVVEPVRLSGRSVVLFRYRRIGEDVLDHRQRLGMRGSPGSAVRLRVASDEPPV